MPETLRFDLTLYPAPVLRRPAEAVEAFDDELARIVDAMYARMFESQGVGLAAPQVSLKRRILVLNPSGERSEDLALVNPTVTVDRTSEKKRFDEGCLSFPGIYAEIERPDRCHVEAFDVQGRPFQGDYEGFVSRIIQHEYDHLEGVLLVDRMSPADKLRNKVALEELVERYREEQRAASGRR